MRVRTILAFILVAATATLTAQADEQLDGRLPFNTHPERYRPPRSHHDWVRLASPTPTRYGTEYIVVGRDVGWFRTLRIEAVRGSVYVRHVRIMNRGRFGRTYYVQRALDRAHPIVYVDLGTPQTIEQLAVTTDRYPIGVYTVDGSSGPIPQGHVVAER